MHLQRWLTAIVGIPLLILLIGKGGILLFAAAVCVVAAIALWEYYGIVFNKQAQSPTGVIPLTGMLFCPMICYAALISAVDIVLCLIAVNVLITGIVALTQYKQNPTIFEVVSKQMLGVMYIPVLFSYFIFLRNSSDGAAWVFFLLIIVFSCDTGALYAGTFFGKHKLCPSVSPGKTIEGGLGGLALGMITGSIFKYFFLPGLSWGLSILFFIIIGVVGCTGDLFESVIKRTGDIKDSGKILPGHGGILDRIDALIFAVPVAYFFKTYVF